MFKDTRDLLDYISKNQHTERRDLEYKNGESWNSLKFKITQAVLAISNLEHGGYIIVGVEKGNNLMPFKAVGMTENIAKTYGQDEVTSFVNDRADPHAKIEVRSFNHKQKYFVAIQVFEFKEIPVICKKGSDMLVRGRIYHRRTRKNESSSETTAEELREIIELAVDKGIKKQKQRISKYEKEDNQFEEERKDF